MIYTKNNQMGFEQIIARHKGVLITLAEGRDWVSIYSCESSNRGKGEVQEAIRIIKVDFQGKKLCGSIPLNPTMKHIYDKMDVSYQL